MLVSSSMMRTTAAAGRCASGRRGGVVTSYGAAWRPLHQHRSTNSNSNSRCNTPSRLPLLTASAAAADGAVPSQQPDDAPSPPGATTTAAAAAEWAALTERLVKASTLPFALLVLPQVLQNAFNMAAGFYGALA